MSLLGSLGGRVGSRIFAAGLASAGAYAALQQCGFLTPQTAHLEEAPAKKGALDPNEWRSFKVVSKEPVTHNTSKLRFATPNPDDESGLFVASCLLTRAPIGSQNEDGSRKYVIRPYTPTTTPDTKGYFDLVVKGYPEGKMSWHIVNLEPGDTLECKGPIPKLPYKPNMKKSIGMIAGGSGVTPMLQVVQEVLRNPEDKTEVSLIFANLSDKDILLREEFDAMARKHSNFKVFYTVDKPSSFWWRGGVGYVTKDMIKQHLPPPSDDSLILVCGPPPQMRAISGEKAKDKSQGELMGLLKDMGYSAEGVYKF